VRKAKKKEKIIIIIINRLHFAYNEGLWTTFNKIALQVDSQTLYPKNFEVYPTNL